MRTKVTGIYVFFITIFYLFVTSCADERMTEKGIHPVPDGYARLQLHTNIGSYQQPTTKVGTADESSIANSPWVIVFEGNGNDATFVEAQQASGSFVTLQEQSSNCRLLVIANAPASFYNGTNSIEFNQANLTSQLTGQTFSNAVNNILLTTQLNSPLQTTVPYTPNHTLPMSNVLDVAKIDNTITIGTSESKFMLSRIVSKVTVTNNDGGFNLLGAALVNAPRNGRLYEDAVTPRNNAGNLTDYLTSINNDGVVGIAPTGGTQNTNANPIYVYNSAIADQASIIIQGQFEGVSYFYKMAFLSNSTGLDILPNHHYEFTINSIKQAGYSSIADAKANPAMNISFDITVTDLGSYSIVDNGQFYLGVSNSELVEYATAGENINNIVAFTIYTDAPNDVTTRNISIDPPSTGLTLTTTSVNVTGGIASTDVLVNMGAAFTSGSITVELGNLKKTVKLSRKAIDAAGVIEEYNTNYINATNTENSWTLFSIDGNSYASTVLRTTPGSVFIHILPNAGNVGSTRTGSAYLSRPDDSGRVKISINQPFEQLASFDITCGSASANGIYVAGQALNASNTITLTVNVTTPGIWEVKSNTFEGISFYGSGNFATAGTQTITLQGSGTPTGNTIKFITLETNSDTPTSCVVKVRMILPQKRILSMGQNGWAIHSPSGVANMFKNEANFGPNESSKFKTYVPVVSPNPGTYVNGLITSTTLQQYLEPGSGDPVDIVVATYNADLSGAAASTMMANYVRRGGVLIMLNEHNREQIANFNMIDAIFSSIPAAATDNVVQAGTVLKLPTVDDEILNGPFGDVRGKYVGEDQGFGDVFTTLPMAEIDWYVTSEDFSGTGGSAGQIFAFKAKNYNLFWCGDGGLASGNGTTGFTAYPITLTGDNRPSSRLYGRNAANRQIVDNATLFANLIAWGLQQAEFNGINTRKK